jgi:glutathione S-transferase
MKLYGAVNRKSFNTMKIRAALAEAGAGYDFVPVDLTKGENRTPAFLALNPHGKIPVLVDDDGFALPESDAILWYVAEKYPGAKLLPATPQGRARVLQWCDFASTGLYPAYADWRTHGAGEIGDKALGKIERAVGVMETALASREYLAGGDVSIADLAGAAIVQSLKLHLPADPLARAPRAQDWYARITSRPGWQKALAD